MFDQIRMMYEANLWSSLTHISPYALAFCGSDSAKTDFDGSMDTGGKSCRKRQQIIVMIADAFLESKEYKKAEPLYKEAIQLRKQFKNVKRSSGDLAAVPGPSGPLPASDDSNNDSKLSNNSSDVEVKFKLHQCYLNMNQINQAVSVLQTIPAKQRNIKSNLALGKLYQHAEMERPAIACFREVLKACPMSMEAAQALMQLGVKPREIIELTNDSGNSMTFDWFNQWIQAFSAFANRDYVASIASLKQLEDTQPLLRNNLHILVTLGQAHHYSGNFPAATLTLQRVHRLDPNHLHGMDILAVLLAKERKLKELEQLATRLMQISETVPEPWIAMGYYCYANKKGSKAMYFGQKACMLHTKSVEALLLKGNLLLDMKKLQNAMDHFREAIQIAPYRYEIHKGLVDCYLAQSRHREAVSVATAACKQLNNSQRALTLFATVLSKDPLHMSTAKAKALLEKALATDPHYLPAVYLLSEILEQEVDTEKAIELLRKQLNHQSTGKLHQMLADLLAKSHDEEKAMHHYSVALNLDPKNVPAQEGLQKMEHATDTALDATYDLEMEEMNSDDADLEESETEAVWSDGDLNLASSNVSF
jgi:anaphase-promoting complex subunit 7